MSSTSKPQGHRWHAALYDLLVGVDGKMTPLRDLIAGGAAGRVLEVGCGTGLNLSHVNWANVETFDATDPDAFMLAKAKEKAATLPPEVQARLRFHEAPAEALPFEDESFDVVIATLVYCTVTDVAKALAETARVLKPGGQLRLVEHVAAHGVRGGVQAVVQPVYGWFAADCQLRRDIEAAVRSAGFDLDVLDRFSLGPLWPGFTGVATKPSPDSAGS